MTKSSNRKVKDLLISSWNDDHLLASEYEVILNKIALDVDSSYSMFVYYCLLTRDYEQLIKRSIDVHHYDDATAYFKDNLLYSMVKKYPHWEISVQPRLEAMKTFISCENECREYNRRASHSAPLTGVDEVSSIILIATRKIASVLGNVPNVSSLPFQFGPGAAFSIKRRTTAYEKLSGALDVTPEAVGHAVKYLQSCPGWLSLHGINHSDTLRIKQCLTILDGDRLSFVPKTALTERPIAIGPTMNVLLQKGIGSIIRRKLKRTGLCLNTAQQKHRLLAKQASRDGSLATVDLSNASDTISWRVVIDLLPFDWFCLLDETRSKAYTIDGLWYPYHKFSAMGNGFTFELESLIFFALAFACTKFLGLDTNDVSVYGDDIILPTGAVELLYSALDTHGFKVNKEKSFNSGPFRESCGGDFFHGVPVRGFYCKGFMTLAEIVRLRNFLYRTDWRYGLKKTWRHLRFLLRDYERLIAGPDDSSDDHIIYDDYVPGKKYSYVSLQKQSRRMPRAFLRAKVYYLYQIMQRGSRELPVDYGLRRLTYDATPVREPESARDAINHLTLIWVNDLRISTESKLTGEVDDVKLLKRC